MVTCCGAQGMANGKRVANLATTFPLIQSTLDTGPTQSQITSHRLACHSDIDPSPSGQLRLMNPQMPEGLNITRRCVETTFRCLPPHNTLPTSLSFHSTHSSFMVSYSNRSAMNWAISRPDVKHTRNLGHQSIFVPSGPDGSTLITYTDGSRHICLAHFHCKVTSTTSRLAHESLGAQDVCRVELLHLSSGRKWN